MDISSHPIRVKSYWDWLPLEIQEHIMSFVVSQQLIDARNKDSWKALCHEFSDYAKLKEAWGFDTVKVVQYKCDWWFCHCYELFHTKILLTYPDVYHQKRQSCLRDINLSDDMDVLLKRIAKEKEYLRDHDLLELDNS